MIISLHCKGGAVETERRRAESIERDFTERQCLNWISKGQ